MRGFYVFFRFSGVQISLIKNWYPEINNNISKAVACPVSTAEKKIEDILICTFTNSHKVAISSFYLFSKLIELTFIFDLFWSQKHHLLFVFQTTVPLQCCKSGYHVVAVFRLN